MNKRYELQFRMWANVDAVGDSAGWNEVIQSDDLTEIMAFYEERVENLGEDIQYQIVEIATIKQSMKS